MQELHLKGPTMTDVNPAAARRGGTERRGNNLGRIERPQPERGRGMEEVGLPCQLARGDNAQHTWPMLPGELEHFIQGMT